MPNIDLVIVILNALITFARAAEAARKLLGYLGGEGPGGKEAPEAPSGQRGLKQKPRVRTSGLVT